MTEPLSPLSVANWFIIKANSQGKYLTSPIIQKLVYLSDIWCNHLYKVSLLNSSYEKKLYGPIYQDVYNESICYGTDEIKSLLSVDIISGQDPRISLLERIWEVYGEYTYFQLSKIVLEGSGKIVTPFHNI
jgi:uncharacterized phage-associated protein